MAVYQQGTNNFIIPQYQYDTVNDIKLIVA